MLPLTNSPDWSVVFHEPVIGTVSGAIGRSVSRHGRRRVDLLIHNWQRDDGYRFVDHRSVDHRFVDHRFVDHRFVRYRFVDHRFVRYRFVDHRFVDHRFVDHRFVDHRFVDHRFVRYRFVGCRFVGCRFVDDLGEGDLLGLPSAIAVAPVVLPTTRAVAAVTDSSVEPCAVWLVAVSG